ncbi:MAG: hydrogenase maturation nickel metallochaperone HypA [Chloroflexota bacterium]
MHELSLAQSLLARVLEEARKQDSGRVKAIYARIGEGSHPMEADSLRDCLEMVSQGTIAEGAELKLEILPSTLKCQGCGFTFSAREGVLVCPCCKSGRLEELDSEELLEIQVE